MQLGRAHPSTLRAMFQLAAARLANGDYSEARDILETMTGHSDDYFQPGMLRYRLELSRAYFLVGKTQRARKLALHVAIHQLQFDRPGTLMNGHFRNFRRADCARDHVPVQGALAYLAAKFKALVKAGSSFRVHPYFTTTLQHLATMAVRAQEEVPGEELGVLIGLIRDVKTLRNDKNIPQDMADARLDYALALLLKEMPAEEKDPLASAAELLQSVMEWRKQELGGSHLDTIRAYRELMIVYSMRALSDLTQGRPVDISLQEVQVRSCSILDSLESSLGSYHPETLQSRLWCFTVTLLISSNQRGDDDKTKSSSTGQEIYDAAYTILARARAPFVRQERYIEALKIEKTVFDLLLGAEIIEPPLRNFLEHAQKDISETIESENGTCAELEELKISFRELWQLYQKSFSM
ncbi:hypothetical protein PG991_003240 [Apiospora marii]|uniref:Uncharacterized protein n=1 Tax=Apiospora marii TaxID=335849 RepID=A0ABR1SHR2_9PEZI